MCVAGAEEEEEAEDAPDEERDGQPAGGKGGEALQRWPRKSDGPLHGRRVNRMRGGAGAAAC